MAIRAKDGSVLPFTQVVTENDVAKGQIRVPSVGDLKRHFSRAPTDIEITLNGRQMTVPWDPRYGPDKERSGVLRPGRDQLAELVASGEVLRIHHNTRGELLIGDRGSKLRIQQWVNRHPADFNDRIRDRCPTLADFIEDRAPTWISPLGHPDWEGTAAKAPFYEFKADLWPALGLAGPPPNPGFWPDQGPSWDGAASLEGATGEPGVLLVEAKSHAAEAETSCSAKPGEGRELIAQSLERVKRYVAADPDADWLNGYYQLANRLAFLYYLRVRLNIPTWLVLVNFTGDAFDGSSSTFPATKDGWREPMNRSIDHLGLPACDGLRPFVIPIFPPATGP